MYPKIRLEEEGAKILLVGALPAGTKYTGESIIDRLYISHSISNILIITGKYGYPVKSDLSIDSLTDIEAIDALVLPGRYQ